MADPSGEDADAARVGRIRRFFAAVKTGDASTVAQILRADPRVVFAQEDGYMAIHYAVAYKCRAVIRVLLKTRCPLSIKDPMGRTPATIAVEVADDPKLGAVLRELEFRRSRTLEYRLVDRAVKRMPETEQKLTEATLLALSKARSVPGVSPWANPPKKR